MLSLSYQMNNIGPRMSSVSARRRQPNFPFKINSRLFVKSKNNFASHKNLAKKTLKSQQHTIHWINSKYLWANALLSNLYNIAHISEMMKRSTMSFWKRIMYDFLKVIYSWLSSIVQFSYQLSRKNIYGSVTHEVQFLFPTSWKHLLFFCLRYTTKILHLLYIVKLVCYVAYLPNNIHFN